MRCRFAIVILCLWVLALGGCQPEPFEPAGPQPRASRETLTFDIPTNQITRGAVTSEVAVWGYQPVIVRGYGLVVGLRGTGSRDIPPQLRAYMLQEMARHGVGQEKYVGGDLGRMSPEQLLDSLDTAIVVVEAVMPPASIGRKGSGRGTGRGTRFDVRVAADPRTGTTSLEGGTLWTAELRPGAPAAGGRQAAALAEARGPIFMNPFAGADSSRINRTTGLILNGGEALEDIPLKLRLGRPSHNRAAALITAINSRFPAEPGQRDPTARGESDELIRISVPPSWRDRTGEFVNVLRYTSLNRAGEEATAMRVQRSVVEDPGLGNDAYWRWYAIGPRAIPTIQQLYDSADERPRLAALRAGAKLNDARVTPHLIEMARSASSSARQDAIGLLGEMGVDPRIDMALRGLLNDENVDIRLAAYEAAIERHDPMIERRNVGGKMIVDLIPSEQPLIYITQINQPRIAVFDPDLALERPLTARLWEDRMIIREYQDEQIELYYQPPGARSGGVYLVDARLPEFIEFLAHDPSVQDPTPGLGLSYGETVAVLHGVWRQQYISGDFKSQQDRVLAAIRDREAEQLPEERPEFADPDFEIVKPGS